MDDKVKILLVDDHEMFRDGLKALLAGHEHYECIATATNGLEAQEIIQQQDIDLVITDLSMPKMTGTELVKWIKATHAHIKVLVVSMHNSQETVNEILLSEAEGYILKNTGKKELLHALDRIFNDGTYYSREVLSNMLVKLKADKKQNEATKSLTERELEVLRLIVDEKTSDEIANTLFISKRTVDTHRKNILEKLNIRTTVGLIKYAFINGLVDS